VFYDPKTGVHVAATRSIASRARSRQLTLTFNISRLPSPEELGNGGRVLWVAGRPGEAPVYAGTDFIIARDGQIAALFLSKKLTPDPAVAGNDEICPGVNWRLTRAARYP